VSWLLFSDPDFRMSRPDMMREIWLQVLVNIILEIWNIWNGALKNLHMNFKRRKLSNFVPTVRGIWMKSQDIARGRSPQQGHIP